MTVELNLTPPRNRRGKAPEPPPTRVPGGPQGRVPRVARLVALAIKFENMIDQGEIHDYAELARLGYVSRARITQIMNLLNLAPDIQEAILFLPPGFGRGPITERHLRRLSSMIHWSEQRRLWRELRSALQVGSPPISRIRSKESVGILVRGPASATRAGK